MEQIRVLNFSLSLSLSTPVFLSLSLSLSLCVSVCLFLFLSHLKLTGYHKSKNMAGLTGIKLKKLIFIFIYDIYFYFFT